MLLLFLGFIVTSSLVSGLSDSTGLRLFVGVTASLVVPWLLALWSRSRPRGLKLSTRFAVGLTNLVLVAGAVLVAPRQTRAAMDRHGAWWAAAMSRAMGRDPRNPVVLRAQGLVSWVARLLPVAGTGSGPDPAAPPSRERPPGHADAGPPASRSDSTAPGRPPDRASTGASVQVTFERRQSAIVVPVQLRGSEGEISAKMVFDTGASLTTLNDATLRRLGVTPESLTVEVRTANGVARRPLAIIEGVSVGGAVVRGGLTVAVCEPCAEGEVVGLLGLNVSGRFRVTLDHEAGQLLLEPKPDRTQLGDISPWVELRGARGLWRGSLLTVDVTVENRAPRALRNVEVVAVVAAGAKEGRVVGQLLGVPARGSAPLQLKGLLPVRGSAFRLRVEQASW